MFFKTTIRCLLAVALVVSTVAAKADVFHMTGGQTSLETVWVANTKNPNDPATGTLYGKVDYTYQMGKYEVTAGQYCEFLNEKAKTDTYSLYNTNMWSNTYGCKIQRGSISGSYTYSVKAGYENRPVNYVSWYDSLRFINWLQNGQGTGSTESGTYTITGGSLNTSVTIPTAADRASWDNAHKHWVLPSQNEWYKAAYYDPNKLGVGNAGYWYYPTKHDSGLPPGRDMADTSGNNANYYGTPWPIDSDKYTTVVGEFQNSASPYGTFDQGGNVLEWNEAIIYGSDREARGGSFMTLTSGLASSGRDFYKPPYEDSYIGFRVASVPEPGGLTLLLSCAVAFGIWRICRRKPLALSPSH